MKTLLTLITMVLVACSAHAGIGKATIPITHSYRGSSTNYITTIVYLTNITSHPVKVTAIFYGKDGSIMPSSYVNYYNFSNSNTEIAANSSAYIELDAPTVSNLNYGKASIEWTNLAGADDTVGLIGHAYLYRNLAGTEGRWSIPINNGMPF